MNSPCCSSECLAKLLEHQLDGVEEAITIEHLNHCSSCRERLESMTAEPDFWNDVGLQLKPIDLDHRCGTPTNRGTPEVAEQSFAPNTSVPGQAAARASQQVVRTVDDFSTAVEGNVAESKNSDQVAAIHFIKQLLVPTDDPESMGKLGIYEIKGIIGVGGMGVVLKGLDASLQRTVAIKVLASHLTTNGAARQRFAREAQAAASVVHENVMAIHAIDEWQGVPYFVMPLVRGESLEKRLKRTGAMDLLEILRIARQIAAGLHEAHKQGLVHRDIKPANILMEHGSERLKIADFGLARAGDDASLTRSGHILGTPLYMSPEQARGEYVDTRSDIFSFGSLLYALATGHPPFRAETPYGVIRRLCEEEPRSIQEYNPLIPFWLSGIIERMISKRAENRINDANELANLFSAGLVYSQQSVETELPLELRSFVGKLEALHPPISRTSLRSRLSAAALILFVVWAGYGAWTFSAGPSKETTAAAINSNSTESLSQETEQTNGDAVKTTPGSSRVDAQQSTGEQRTSEVSISEMRPVDPLSQKSNATILNADPEPIAHDLKRSYRFRVGEHLKYRCEIELTSAEQALIVTGDIALQTVEVENEFAEFEYQIQWNHSVKSQVDSDELVVAQQAPETRVIARHPWGVFPLHRGGFAPSIQIPSFFAESPFSNRPTAFGFELQELQNCELAGRAKIGLEGKLIGCSHRSELPGQFGRVLEWIFPAVGTPSDGLLWNSSSNFALTTPTHSNLDDWNQRQRIQVRRDSEFEIRQAEGLASNRTMVQFVAVDNSTEDRTIENPPIQTLLGNLELDANSGQLESLRVIRSNLPLLQNEVTAALRPAKMEIRRVD